MFGRQVENCSASWRRQNPFLLAIFCNENSKNECAITCGNKFQILSHKSSLLKISDCKLTPPYLNFKMLIFLCVWIAAKESFKKILSDIKSYRQAKLRQMKAMLKAAPGQKSVWCRDTRSRVLLLLFPSSNQLQDDSLPLERGSRPAWKR